jgi:hypothetical protein
MSTARQVYPVCATWDDVCLVPQTTEGKLNNALREHKELGLGTAFAEVVANKKFVH